MALSPLQLILNRARDVISRGKESFVSGIARRKAKAPTERSVLSGLFGKGVVDDVATKANQIVSQGKQALAERSQQPVRMNAKETLITKPLKVTKDIAQGFGYGASYLTKSGIQLLGGEKAVEKYSNPEIEKMLFGRETSTLQDFTKRTGRYAEEKGSSKSQRLALQGVGILGSIFAENPLNFSKTPAKNLLKTLAKETDEQVIKGVLKKEIKDIPDEAIDILAPKIAKATDNNAVKSIFDGVSKKVDPLVEEAKKYKTADEFVSNKLSPAGRVKTSEIENVFRLIEDGTVEPKGIITKKGNKLFPVDEKAKSILERSSIALNDDGSIKESIMYSRNNFLDDTIESQKLTDIWNKANVSPETPIKKQIKPVDRLIAEGKIRVVRRGDRDVYQTKKGDTWVNARDEDSAVAKMTPKPKQEINLPEKLEQDKMLVEFQKEELKRDPARELTKYMNKRAGELPEVGATNSKSKFAREGDVMAEGLGFKDSEEARQAVQGFLKRKAETLDSEKAIKAKIKEFKQEAKIKSPIDSVVKKKSAIPQAEVKSIEKQAQQVKEIMDSDYRKIHDVSLPSIVQQTITPVTKKVHLIDTMLTTPKFVMEKIGFGKEAKQLRSAMDEYWKELPRNLEKITDWSKQVPKESSERIFKYLDGQSIKLNPKELEVAGEIKIWLRQWADRLGLKQDNRVTDYITRLFDNGNQKEFDEELAKLIADKIPGSVYSPFTLKRLGAKGYKQDVWEALDAYTKRSTRKVHMDPVLERIQNKAGSSLEFTSLEESQFNYIQKYIESINMRPTKTDKSIDNFVKNIPYIGTKFGQRPVANITRMLRRMTGRGMLGLNPGSALRNLSQGINTYAVLGEKYTVIGYAKLFNKGSMRELVEEGVLNAGFIEDRVLSATKKKIKMLDKGLFAMFDTVEKINRGSAYFGAKAKALAEGKSLQEAIDYGKEIVRKTQFAFDAVDNPVGMSSDLMKTLFQFQTFTTKQIEFLGGMVKDKNFKGLARYTLAGLAFVYTIGQAMGMEPKELLPMYRFQTPPSLKAPVEVTKAVVDAPDKYGKKRDLKTKLKDISKSGIGLLPGGVQIRKTIQGIEASKEGGSFDRAGRLQFEVGSTTTEKLQAVLFGKYANENAKEYFEDIESSGKVDKRIKKLYEMLQDMKETDPDMAIESYKALSDEDKKSYQSYKKSVEQEAKVEEKKEFFPTYKEIREMKKTNPDGALEAYKALPDNQKEIYQTLLEAEKKVEAKVEKQEKAEKSTIKFITDYARALVIDPSQAFKAIVTKEKLGTVKGNLVGFERFYGKEFNKKGGSEEYVYKLLDEMGIPASERSNYNLEHIVPLTAGGDNSPENLKIVDRETHNSWTEIDIALGKAMKEKRINRKRAEKIAKDFKNGLINKEDVYKLIK